jgi:AcrR family transcriptional regulator
MHFASTITDNINRSSKAMTRVTRPRSRRGEEVGDGGRRDIRKQRTRRGLLDAALQLIQGDQSFNSISLREVARNAGVVPTAFYRHFRDMDELGLTLVEESLRALRQMMREVRSNPLPSGSLITRSVQTYLGYVQENRDYFQFLARERFGGSRSLRINIRQGISLFISELATDLARFPAANRLSTEDLQMISSLIVNIMILTTEQLLDLPLDNEEEARWLEDQAAQQMRLVFLGSQQWRSKADRDKQNALAQG